ncbi:MAG: DUF1080 domain-containing protein [Gemmataceae bacterium]|nr:DUF1080 domain-containing protein [Gemmataceae bacterium]
MKYPRLNFLRILASIFLFAGLICNLRAEDKEAAEAKKWKALFNGKNLDGWKAADFFKPGKVYVKDGAIVMEPGTKMTGVTYDKKDFPKVNYEVEFEGKRINGRDFFGTVTFPVADSFCSFVVGGWGGSVIGLSNIDGVDASENSTGQAKDFKDNQWYKIRVLVTNSYLGCWIDNENLVDQDTTGMKISIRIECNESRPFGFATYDTTGAVRNIRVRPLTEAEVKAAKPKK